MILLAWWSRFSKKKNFKTCFHYIGTMVTEIGFSVLVLISGELNYDVIFYIMPFTWIPIPSMFMHPFILNPNQNICREEMAPLNRFEISGPELVESNPEATTLFDHIGWGLFFKGFSGHHVGISKQFTLSLKNDAAQIGDFRLVLNEDIIVEATKLPQVCEHWFKGQKVNKKKCEMFLLPLPEGSDLVRGVFVKFLKPQWRACFEILIRYVTCDGRYSHTLIYITIIYGC